MKPSEIRELSVTDLEEKVEALKVQQNKLRLSHAVTQLENPIQLRVNRRTIARLKTELRSRQLNELKTSKT